MTDSIPDPAYDEPAGDSGDQASRLQMLEEQEAIRAALAGRVDGTDSLQELGGVIRPLEGNDPLDQDSDDASDDPDHAGGSTEAADDARELLRDEFPVDVDVPEDGAAVAADEGSSL